MRMGLKAMGSTRMSARLNGGMAQVCALAVGAVMGLAQGQALAQTESAANAKLPKATGAAKAAPAKKAGARHLLWSDLVPEGWDPMATFRERFKDPKLAMMDDTDPQVVAMMNELREIWDKAPVNPKMDGVTGRLPGYIVPLDDQRGGMRSFLLVPYYGACIHSPPPPANQIVLVHSDKPIKGFQSMDTVWVHGTLQAFRGDSAMGVSGWRIDAVKVERYKRPPVETAQ